jgi:hypothetical protein
MQGLFVRTVIDSQGNVKHFAPPPNASYTMDGTEKYINKISMKNYLPKQ